MTEREAHEAAVREWRAVVELNERLKWWFVGMAGFAVLCAIVATVAAICA